MIALSRPFEEDRNTIVLLTTLVLFYVFVLFLNGSGGTVVAHLFNILTDPLI